MDSYSRGLLFSTPRRNGKPAARGRTPFTPRTPAFEDISNAGGIPYVLSSSRQPARSQQVETNEQNGTNKKLDQFYTELRDLILWKENRVSIKFFVIGLSYLFLICVLKRSVLSSLFFFMFCHIVLGFILWIPGKLASRRLVYLGILSRMKLPSLDKDIFLALCGDGYDILLSFANMYNRVVSWTSLHSSVAWIAFTYILYRILEFMGDGIVVSLCFLALFIVPFFVMKNNVMAKKETMSEFWKDE